MAGFAVQLLTPTAQYGRQMLLAPTVFLPIVLWATLAGLRAMIFAGLQRSADGWDEVRKADLDQRISCGRRSLEIVGASLHTALRAPDSDIYTQIDRMIEGESALKSQVSRFGGVARHSRLPGKADEAAEDLLSRAFGNVLADLAPLLVQFHSDKPVALMLSVETCVPEQTLEEIWSQAWRESGIRQAPIPISERGITVIDHWLDQRVTDQSLLMVIAVQVAPSNVDDTAEAAVGLLLANPTKGSGATTLASLHRPEPERDQDEKSPLRAMRQAMDWVPLQPEQISHVWREGDVSRNGALASLMPEAFPAVDASQGVSNLDALLGRAGSVAPWLAIVGAVLNLQREAKPQFVLSGEGSAEAELWGMVLTPVSARP